MIKEKNKINKKIFVSALLLITILFNIMPISNATELSGEINIYCIGFSKNLLFYKNSSYLTIFDVYKLNGTEYPAYNALYPTYTYNNPYEEELIEENSFLWQVAVNGYPYKTIEELGCDTYAEAYTATQAAIYCAYCGHLESDYSYDATNEASIKTYNAFISILENAKNNKITTNHNDNNVVKLINLEEDWQLDNEEYIYKTYSVKTNYSIDKYKVEILNCNNAIITDENQNVKTEFNKNENFRISLPIDYLKNSGELEIAITTDVENTKVYLGTSPYNSYVMTTPKYEKKVNTFFQTYQENLTSINIKVQEADTKIGIENSIVNLLDSNKNIISTLTTDEQGKIFIEHLLPGKYYIEQIATEDMYNAYTKQIELNMDYNKVLNLTINNASKNVENIYNKEENIVITEEIIEKNINNEKINTNINNKVETIKENNINNEYTENNETIDNNINNENTNTNINNKAETTNENNVNNKYTENKETVDNNINNENTNININNKVETTNENNVNNDYTENNKTVITNTTNLSKVSNSNNENIKSVQNTTQEVKKLPKTGM